MKARCGLEDCDCEYTIEKLMKGLEAVRDLALPEDWHHEGDIEDIYDTARAAITEAKRGRP